MSRLSPPAWSPLRGSPAPGRPSLSLSLTTPKPSPIQQPQTSALGERQNRQHKEVCPKQGHGFGGGYSGRRSASCWVEVMSSTENQSERSLLGISKAKLAVPYGNAEQHAHTVTGQRNLFQECMWPVMFSLLHFGETCMEISR